MLRISWQTLRTRRASLAGAFLAIWLAVTLGYATAQLLAGALGGFGPGRFAAADHMLSAEATVTYGHGEGAERVPAIPGPRRGPRARPPPPRPPAPRLGGGRSRGRAGRRARGRRRDVRGGRLARR